MIDSEFNDPILNHLPNHHGPTIHQDIHWSRSNKPAKCQVSPTHSSRHFKTIRLTLDNYMKYNTLSTTHLIQAYNTIPWHLSYE